jgi:hypothetical protein
MSNLCTAKCVSKSCLLLINRTFTISAAVCGRKSRDPYDRRFGIHPKDAGRAERENCSSRSVVEVSTSCLSYIYAVMAAKMHRDYLYVIVG